MKTADINKYLKERSERLLAECKDALGNKCLRCGSSNNLQFHHRDPDSKEFEVSKARSVSAERLKTELEKCDLLCAECHRNVHAAKHGSWRKYQNGCRCDECRLSHNLRLRDYRRKKRREAGCKEYRKRG